MSHDRQIKNHGRESILQRHHRQKGRTVRNDRVGSGSGVSNNGVHDDESENQRSINTFTTVTKDSNSNVKNEDDDNVDGDEDDDFYYYDDDDEISREHPLVFQFAIEFFCLLFSHKALSS